MSSDSPRPPALDLGDDPRTQAFDLGQGPPCLLLHGFTGTPYEMRPLGEALARQGYRAVGPRIAGHASTLESFSAHDAGTWYDGVRSSLESLIREAGGVKVHLLGLSLGGMLALRLAAEHSGQVATLTLLAPAARFSVPLRVFFRLFRYRALAARWPTWAKEGMGLEDRELAAEAPRMLEIPTSAAKEVVRTIDAGWDSASRVGAPSLVIYGGRDHTVSAAGVMALAARLRPPPVEVLRLARSGHVLPLDVERELLASTVTHFLRSRDALRG